MKKKQLHDNTHLALRERKIIQAGIENNSSKASIAQTIGKDAATVAKEIRKHRMLKPSNTFNHPILCARMGTCLKKPCIKKCDLYKEPRCNRRDKSPGVIWTSGQVYLTLLGFSMLLTAYQLFYASRSLGRSFLTLSMPTFGNLFLLLFSPLLL